MDVDLPHGSARPLPDRIAWTGQRTDVLAIASWMALVASVVALAVALEDASLRLDGYGIASSLPAGYYLGLALLPVASALQWLRGRDANQLLVACHIVLFILVVWFTPLLLEGTARFRTSYTNFGYVDPILRGDGLLPQLFVYHNWPLFPVVMAALISVGIPPMPLMAAFPAVMMLLYLIPLGILLRTLESTSAPTGEDIDDQARSGDTTGAGKRSDGARRDPASTSSVHTAVTRARDVLLRRRDGKDPAAERHAETSAPIWLAGLWLFVLFDWTGQDYFSPQALAFLFLLGWLAVLAHVALRSEGRFDAVTLSLTLGLFTLIVLTHVLTSLVALSVLFALIVTRHIRRWTLLVTSGLIFLVWQANGGAPFYDFYGDRLLQSILAAGHFLEENLESRVTGSDAHTTIVQIRILVTAVIFGLAGLAALASLRGRRWPRPVGFAVAYLLGIAIVTPVSAYGGEMLMRTLLFSLPMLAALVVTVPWPRPQLSLLLAGVLSLAAPAHILTHYGNELLDYVSPAEVEAFRFVGERLAPANIYGGFPAGSTFNTVRLDARNSYLSRKVEPATLADFQNPWRRHTWRHPDWPLYVIVGRGDAAALELFQDRRGFIQDVKAFLQTSPAHQLVFQNADVVIYRWHRTATSR